MPCGAQRTDLPRDWVRATFLEAVPALGGILLWYSGAPEGQYGPTADEAVS